MTMDITRTWEIDAGRFATVTFPGDATVDDVESFEEFLSLLKQEIALRWNLKRGGAREPTPMAVTATPPPAPPGPSDATPGRG